MTVHLTEEEIIILRGLVLGHQKPLELMQCTRERIVLKLHEALEEMREEEILRNSRSIVIQ
jgi:hypothetical protein